MVQNEIGIIAAFLAGLASFVSPCVLPLVPAYLSFMSGVSISEMKADTKDRRKISSVFFSSLAFVAGFSIVFIALGATASVVGRVLLENLPTIARIAGVLIVILGIHMTGLVKIPFLSMEKRFQTSGGAGLLASMVMGLAFAFGWTPCIGPILAGILALAANAETVGTGILLLACYSAGLGIPFILAGLFLNVFYGFFGKIQNHFHKIEIVSGVVLILVGVLLIFDQFTLISAKFSEWMPTEIG